MVRLRFFDAVLAVLILLYATGYLFAESPTTLVEHEGIRQLHAEAIRVREAAGRSYRHTAGPITRKEKIRRFSIEDMQRVVSLRESGCSQYAIADQFGVRQSVISAVLKRCGVPSKRNHQRLSDESVAAIRALNGIKSRSEVSKAFGISRGYVGEIWAGSKRAIA